MRQRPLPPLTVVIERPASHPELPPSTETVVVRGLRPGQRLGDLVGPLGLPAASALSIDRRQVPLTTRLDGSGLRTGSVVAIAAPPGEAPVVWVEWTTGPDAGRTIGLPPGRHLLGRRRGVPLAGDDPRLAAHHAVVEVFVDGTAVVHYLAASATRDPEPLRGDRGVIVGTSSIRLAPRPTPSATRPTRPVGAWSEPLVRSPRLVPASPTTTVTVPGVDPTHDTVPASQFGGTLLAAGMSLVGGVVMMAVFRQPLMLIMSAVTTAGALATVAWQAGRRRSARRSAASATLDRDRRRAALLNEAVRVESARRHALHGVGDALNSCRSGVGLWDRRSGDPDAFSIVLGRGRRMWHPTTADETGRSITPVETLALDLGEVPVPIDIAGSGNADRLRSMPDPAGTAIGVVAPRPLALALARSMVIQLAANVGPGDLTLMFATTASNLDQWRWARWLPHASGEVGPLVGLSSEISPPTAVDGRRTVVIVDDPAALTARTSPIRRMLGHDRSVSVIFIGDDLARLPSACGEAIEINANASAVIHRWTSTSIADTERFSIAGLSAGEAEAAARAMARFDDPERADGVGQLPTEVDLADLLGERAHDAMAMSAGWATAGLDPAPAAVIGVAPDGTVEVDLERDGPHALIGGTTGAGKSELLRTVVAALAVCSPPEALSFILIDYKGGAAFDACAGLPHVVGVVTDLDGRLAARVLVSLDAELHRREDLLRSVGAGDLHAYRRIAAAPEPLPRLVVVVDEFAALATELPDFLAALVSIAQRGRSLGVHLMLATQRPNGVINDDIRANTNLRIALRVQDRADAVDIVGDPAPAALSRRRPGSAMIRLDADELMTFQTARCTGPARASGGDTISVEYPNSGAAPGCTPAHHGTAPPHDTVAPGRGHQARPTVRTDRDTVPDRVAKADRAGDEHDDRARHEHDESDGEQTVLEMLVAAAQTAAERRRVDLPRRPWLDPLPRCLARPEDAQGAGIVDVPATQQRRMLAWHPERGHLVVAGSIGSGTTTALLAAATGLAIGNSPDRLHLYAIDAGGGTGLGNLADLPHCAGVVSGADALRRGRVLRRLAVEADRRRAAGSSNDPIIVLVIDGFAALRSSLESPAHTAQDEQLASLITDGPRLGIVIAASVDRPSDVPSALTARAGARWLFGLTDPWEGSAWGIAASVAIGVGQPGRCVEVESGLDAQVFAPETPGEIVGRAWPGERRPLIDSAHTPAGQARRAARRFWAHGPVPLAELPSVVTVADVVAARAPRTVDDATQLPVGLDPSTVEPAMITLFPGDHIFIGGPPRSGRTTALATLADVWRAAHPNGWIGLVRPRRSAAGALLSGDVTGTLAEVVNAARIQGAAEATGAAGADCRRLIIVDDAELLADDGGLGELLAGPSGVGVTVAVAARPDALRTAYGHWTGAVRRARKGLLLGAIHDLDADVLGTMLPRHRPATPPAGSGFLVEDGRPTAILVAQPDRPPLRQVA